MAAFLDQAGSLWMRGALNGKVGAAFSSSGTQHGGQEATLFSIIAFRHGRRRLALQPSRTDARGRNRRRCALWATTVAGPDGKRQPTSTDLAGARHQGELVAKIAAKLFDK